jgi:hypothetical protein
MAPSLSLSLSHKKKRIHRRTSFLPLAKIAILPPPQAIGNAMDYPPPFPVSSSFLSALALVGANHTSARFCSR